MMPLLRLIFRLDRVVEWDLITGYIQRGVGVGVGLYIASHAWVSVGILSVHQSLLLRNVYSLFSIGVDDDKNWHNERARLVKNGKETLIY